MVKTNFSMADYVEETSKKYPNNIALDFMGKKTTYRELIGKIRTAERALYSLGVRKKDVICVIMPNMPQAIIMIYAANKIGAAVNMIHPLSSENEIESYIRRVEAKYVLVVDQFYEKIDNISKTTELSSIIVASPKEEIGPVKAVLYELSSKAGRIKPNDKTISWNEFLKKGEKSSLELSRIEDRYDPALILNSGGTTGKPKGVCLSNDSVNASALQMMEANPMINSSDRFLSVMPIFHGNGLVIGVHAMLMLGARCVLIPRFTPDSYARDLLKNKCNYMSVVPALFERLMEVDVMKDADLSFLKGIFSGADFLPMDLEEKINNFLKEHNSLLKVRQGYGMTEGVVATTLNPFDDTKPGSIGKPLPGVEIKIVEPGTEKELPIGATGEIVFTSRTNMMGYYNDPEETGLVLREHSDGKKWIHSGDLGYADPEGYYFFKDRIKRMVVVNGYNIFPNEVENIMERFPMVDRCCIAGVPDGQGTKKLAAFVVLKAGYDKSKDTERNIKELCGKAVSKFSVPKEILYLDEIPRTKVGKVDYNSLVKIYAERTHNR